MDNVDELYGNMISTDNLDNSGTNQDDVDEENDYVFYTTRLINCASRRISRYELFDLLQNVTMEDADLWISIFRGLNRVYSMDILEDYTKDVHTLDNVTDEIKHLLIFIKTLLPEIHNEFRMDQEIKREDILVTLEPYNVPNLLTMFIQTSSEEDYIRFLEFVKREAKTEYSEQI